MNPIVNASEKMASISDTLYFLGLVIALSFIFLLIFYFAGIIVRNTDTWD